MSLLSKFVVRWSVVTMVVLLPMGCGSNSNNTSDEASEPSEPSEAIVETTAEDETDSPENVATEPETGTDRPQTSALDLTSASTYQLGETIEYEDTLGSNGKLSVTGMREFAGEGMFEQPEDGSRWLAVTVSIENNGERDYIVTFQEMMLADGDGTLYGQDLRAASVLETDLEAVPAGEAGEGDLAFEVPQDVEIAKLVYDPSNGACEEEDSVLADAYPCDRLPIVVELQ
ncbi:MAG: DUF4352 domain-containing protein [Cyanobacteria bacterium SID2]|nr:DUF4352 domain-containing protein [Cyanobacteria bacterium SID2]MBP0005670.1 DUF4352 domain-containing protein [Cyanobacteria bacterium SBC]